jgi:pSer/pThr/pTyr-binding forkhead associated (FHA) protein
MAFVTVKSGSQEGLLLEIDRDEVIIGRSGDCEITVPDQAVSGRHCAIVREENRYWLRDLESTNGTRLNGGLVKESRLKPGDIIMVGSAELVFDGDDVAVDESVPKTKPRSAPVPTVVLSSGLNSGYASVQEPAVPAFEARHIPRVRWVLLWAIVAATVLGLGYRFVSVLF